MQVLFSSSHFVFETEYAAWLKDTLSGVYVSPGSAETLVRRGGITNQRLTATSLPKIIKIGWSASKLLCTTSVSLFEIQCIYHIQYVLRTTYCRNDEDDRLDATIHDEFQSHLIRGKTTSLTVEGLWVGCSKANRQNGNLGQCSRKFFKISFHFDASLASWRQPYQVLCYQSMCINSSGDKFRVESPKTSMSSPLHLI